MKFRPASFLILLIMILSAYIDIHAQLGAHDRDFALSMLEQVKDEIKKNYFDPKHNGIDLEKNFQDSKAALKQAKTRDEMMLIVAQYVSYLNDSHTTFISPSRAADFDYGWQVGIIGDDCYVTAIKPKSDAEAKGLKVGDRVLTIDGFTIVRENISQLYHRYYSLVPSARVRFEVASPGDTKPRILDITTKISRTSSFIDPQAWYVKYLRKGWDVPRKDHSYEYGTDLLIWRMTSFANGSLEDVKHRIDMMMGKARNYKALILDLRGNGGGYVDAEKRLIGHFFNKDIKIGDEKTRKESKEMIAKTQGANGFKGELIVLVDSESASAAEIFAKIIQLEKRGRVIGDRTAGAVMTSRFFPMSNGTDANVLYFGASITVGDLIMTDGKSLEKIGVKPDMIRLPSGKDMSETKDPVLSYAAKLFGVEITPEKAGTMFPVIWEKL